MLPKSTLLTESVIVIEHVLSKIFSLLDKICDGIVISPIPINELFLVTLIEYLSSFLVRFTL